MNLFERLFRKRPFNAKEELDKIMKRLDDAQAEYDEHPNRINAMRLDGYLDITERLVDRLERLKT